MNNFDLQMNKETQEMQENAIKDVEKIKKKIDYTIKMKKRKNMPMMKESGNNNQKRKRWKIGLS